MEGTIKLRHGAEKELTWRGRQVSRAVATACAKALRLERAWCAQDRKEKLGQVYLSIKDGSLNTFSSMQNSPQCLSFCFPPSLRHLAVA